MRDVVRIWIQVWFQSPYFKLLLSKLSEYKYFFFRFFVKQPGGKINPMNKHIHRSELPRSGSEAFGIPVICLSKEWEFLKDRVCHVTSLGTVHMSVTCTKFGCWEPGLGFGSLPSLLSDTLPVSYVFKLITPKCTFPEQ